MASSARTCYNRDGSEIANDAYQPCINDSTRESFCCGTNHQGAGETNVADDICESNGLCQNYEAFNGSNEGVKLWWRQGCTDPTWQSEECLKDVCNDGQWRSENAPVRKCGKNRWCCGEASCCGDESNLFELAATVGPGAATSISSAIGSLGPSSSTFTLGLDTTSSSSATSPTTDPTSSSNASSTNQGLSVGAKAGIGIATAVILMLLVVVSFLTWKLKKKRKQEQMPVVEVEAPYPAYYQRCVNPTFYAPRELDGTSTPLELGEQERAELGNGRRTPTHGIRGI